MNLIEQFLLWITYLNFGGNKWNILGVLWLLSLCLLYFKRFITHFNNGYFPKPKKNPRSHLWYFAVLIFSFLYIMLIQMLMDDLITTPINLSSGSWNLLVPHLGGFSFLKLFWFKVDVYMLIIIYAITFTMMRLWQFFHFTKYSTILLLSVIAFQIFLGSQHVFYFLDLTGNERLYTFWISYPWFRILTGLFAVSIIKDPESDQEKS